MKSHKIWMILLALSMSGSGTLAAYDYSVVFGNTTTGAGTINLGNPHSTVYSVNSKYSQPRNVNGTNPHMGVDLASPYGTSVLALWNGWVTKADAANYELFIYLDLNNNGKKDDNAHVKYDHLSSVLVSTGAKISKGQAIAKVGNEGGAYPSHLHFGVMKDTGTDGFPDVWVRNEPYYRTVSGWDSGRMLDFISLSGWSNNTASAYAYAHDEGGKESISSGDVVIFHRKKGTSTWTATTATKNGDLFSTNLTGKYTAGTVVQWTMKANRTSIKGAISYYWGYFPPKFYQPSPDPNSTSSTYDYFENTMK